MIKELKLSARSIFLEGLSLKGKLLLHNPNALVALSYKITPITTTVKFNLNSEHCEGIDMAQILTIFPETGLLLKEETHKITIMVRNAECLEVESLLENKLQLQISYTLNNNWNKILIKNRKLASISNSELETHEAIQTVNVEIGTSCIKLKEEILSEISMKETLGKEMSHISEILQDYPERNGGENAIDGEVLNLVESLELQSRIKEEKESTESQYNYFEEDKEWKINIQGQKLNVEENNFRINHQNIQKGYTEEFSPTNEGMKSAVCDEFSKVHSDEEIKSRSCRWSATFVSHESSKKEKMKRISSVELLILALMAGFFYSLGSNVKRYCNN